MRKTIIDMTKVTIFENNVKNELWPKLVLTIINIKKNRLTKAFQNNIDLYKTYFKNVSN